MEELRSYEALSVGNDPSERSRWPEGLSSTTHVPTCGGCRGERNPRVWACGLAYVRDFSNGG